MNYRPEILTAYNDLFKEAHTALSKEASILSPFRRAGQATKRFVGRHLRAGKNVDDLAATQQEAQGLKDVISDMELDAVARKGQLDAVEEAMKSRFGEQFGPEAFNAADRSRRLWRGLGLGALGASGVAAPVAYHMGQEEGEAGKTRTRNLAFGAGAATGLATPHIIRGLGQLAQYANKGLGRTGLQPQQHAYQGGSY